MPPLTDLALALVATLLAILYLRELLLRRQLVRNEQQEVEKARLSAQSIIDNAVKKSQDIIAQSETSSLKILADSKQGLSKGQAIYDEELRRILQQFESGIANELTTTHDRIIKSQSAQEKFLAELDTRFENFQKTIQATLSKEAAASTESFKDNLATSLRSIEDRTTAAVEKDLADEHLAVQHFQEAQIKTVRENLVAILERTFNLVLTKKLTLKDHVDLINESFEEAKKEKFLS